VASRTTAYSAGQDARLYGRQDACRYAKQKPCRQIVQSRDTTLVSQVQKMGTTIDCATGQRREANKAQDGNTCVKKVFDLPTTISISLSNFHNADKRAF